MTARPSQNGISTRNLILKAAFSFYEETVTRDFSMSELAQKVGLSKPAIYRHFKNKEDVLKAMKDEFFNLTAAKISGCDIDSISEDEEKGKKIISNAIDFFVENPALINYFIYQMMQDEGFIVSLAEEFKKRLFIKDDRDFNNRETATFFRAHECYYGISIFFFTKLREQQVLRNKAVKGKEYFSSHLYDFLSSGLRGTARLNNLSYPEEITKERLTELNELCVIQKDYLPEENKMFKAIAKVIREYTSNGVTIERIANELGMAKSSLYFYFENKNQMLYSLAEKELNFLAALCMENIAEAGNISEFIYITMITEINFFLARPSLLSICSWLMQSSAEEPFNKEHEEPGIDVIWNKHLMDFSKVIDLGFDLDPDFLRFWIGILPVAATILKTQNGFNDDQIVETVKYVFHFVENGSSSKRNWRKMLNEKDSYSI